MYAARRPRHEVGAEAVTNSRQWVIDVRASLALRVERAQEDLLAQHLPAPIFEPPFNVAQQFHFLVVHAAVLSSQYANRGIAQDMEVMPLCPRIELRLAFLRLSAEVSYEMSPCRR